MIGWLGIAAGAMTMLFIKEPERGRYDILETVEAKSVDDTDE